MPLRTDLLFDPFDARWPELLAAALHRWVGRISSRVQTGLLVATGALLAVYGAALVGRGAAELRTR